MFAFRLNYVLQKAHELIEFTDYEDLLAKYETLQKISFDYAVVEKEPEIEVMRFAGTWKDLGTWNTLTEAMDSACVGEAVLNETCRNVHVVNELDMPVLCMGLQDIGRGGQPRGDSGIGQRAVQLYQTICEQFYPAGHVRRKILGKLPDHGCGKGKSDDQSDIESRT